MSLNFFLYSSGSAGSGWPEFSKFSSAADFRNNISYKTSPMHLFVKIYFIQLKNTDADDKIQIMLTKCHILGLNGVFHFPRNSKAASLVELTRLLLIPTFRQSKIHLS
jgi:hypothetical protein